MPTISAQIVAAFVDERDGGNLAGVVLDRPELTEEQQQRIAAALGLSETAFVVQHQDGFRVDFFTPNKRVPDCGHATVAAFGVLAQQGRIALDTTIKYTVNGPRTIRIEDGAVFMEQPPAQYRELGDHLAVLSSLGVHGIIGGAGKPTLAFNDVGFIIVPLENPELLASVKPDLERVAAICDAAGAIGYYVWTPGLDEEDATVRMFAPSFGIPEESATGMAAGLLCAYLYNLGGIHKEDFAIDQGVYMTPPSPSRIDARLVLEDKKIASVWVGGQARIRREIAI